MTDTTGLGRRVRELRERAGLEQKEAAKRIGIDASNLSAIEKGKRPAGGRVLRRIADFYGVTVDAIEKGESDSAKVHSGSPDALAALVRRYRLEQWEAIGRFAQEVFSVAVEGQQAALGAVMREAPPEIPTAPLESFRQPTKEEMRAAKPPAKRKHG